MTYALCEPGMALCFVRPTDPKHALVIRDELQKLLETRSMLAIDEEQARRLKLGQSVLLRGANAPIAEDAVLVMSGGKPLGIGTVTQGSLKPKRLFNL